MDWGLGVEGTYDASFQFGWFTVKYISRFDTVFDDPDRTVKKPHQMTIPNQRQS
jgi:hypothetical protein